MRRGFEWPITGALAPLAAILAACLTNPSNADGIAPSNGPPALARQARCDNIGQGFPAPKDSGECLRISGYVAAGANFAPAERIRGLRAPFGPLASPGVVTSVGASMRNLVNAPGRAADVLRHAGDDDIAR